jgi:hypothetical protein
MATRSTRGKPGRPRKRDALELDSMRMLVDHVRALNPRWGAARALKSLLNPPEGAPLTFDLSTEKGRQDQLEAGLKGLLPAQRRNISLALSHGEVIKPETLQKALIKARKSPRR